MKHRAQHFLISALLTKVVAAWIFETSGPGAKEIIDVAFWNNRAFLCMSDKMAPPKPDKNGTDANAVSKAPPRKINYLGSAIFEAPWPEDATQSWGLKALKIEAQELESECMKLKAAVAIDIDARGRMFTLLLGSKNCHPRIAVIDLVVNRQVSRTELTNAPRLTLRSLVVDYLNSDTRVYIGGVTDNLLIVYSFKEELWWRVKLESTGAALPTPPPVPTAHLALAKREGVLYMTSSNSQFLFSMSLEQLSDIDKADGKSECSQNRTLSPKLVGEKLGKSAGLMSDSRGGLIYSLLRDYAVVRWNTHAPLVAENHEVLIQSADLLPDVRQIFKDSQKNVWALNGLRNEEGSYCTRILKLN